MLKIVLCLYIFFILIKCYIALLHFFRDIIYLTKNSDKLYNKNAKQEGVGGNTSIVKVSEANHKKI